jgi:hypothetical protein
MQYGVGCGLRRLFQTAAPSAPAKGANFAGCLAADHTIRGKSDRLPGLSHFGGAAKAIHEMNVFHDASGI